MRYVTALAILGLGLFLAPAASAQTTAIVGAYAPGWNMVGGPTGTTFTGASGLDTFAGGSYSSAPPTVSNPCAGMWAYFADPTVVALPASTGPAVTCPLAPGWNLVGNPFSGSALVPPGTVAYHWNPDTARYDIVSSIPPGASVWINSAGASTVTLQFAPAVQSHVPVLISNSFPANPGPYTLHVGDALKLLIPLSNPYDIVADPNYLALEAAGETGDMSCVGSCVINMLDQFYTYRAVAPGTTALVLTPRCRQSSPPCTESTATVTVNIVP
jgi:hypothetical protein